MNYRWYRWRAFLDALEEVLRSHGTRLEAVARDLGEAFERDGWPETQRDAVLPEIVRRSRDMPFLRDLVEAAERGEEPPRIDDALPWGPGERTRVDRSVARGVPARNEGAGGDRGPVRAPRRIEAAERALHARTRSLAVLLERPTNPRNIAAVARTVEFFGLQELHVIQPEGRERLQGAVTRSCERYLDLHWYRATSDAVRALSDRRLLVVDRDAAAAPLSEVAVASPTVVAFGSEQLGVSDELRAAAHGSAFVPAAGFTAYLNLSTTVGIAVWELDRRLRAADDRSPLADVDRDGLRRSWYACLYGRPDDGAERERWVSDPPAVDAEPRAEARDRSARGRPESEDDRRERSR